MQTLLHDEIPQPQTTMVAQFRSLVPTVVVAVLAGFATSWYNTQNTQADIARRVEQLEKRVETVAVQNASNAALLNQNQVKQAEMSVVQNYLLEQVKEIKDANKNRPR